MNKDNTKHPYKDRKYDVVTYDLGWPVQFESYASKIENIFGKEIQIEHIGSTSVPGMSGKPCVDVLVIVPDIGTVESHVQEMERAGFEYAGQFVMENSRLFRIMKDNTLIANIHFFPSGHPHVGEMLDLRNYLRNNSDEVVAYSNMKKELYEKYANDYASYRKHKDEYMAALKERVLIEKLKSEGYDKVWPYDAEPDEVDEEHSHDFDTLLHVLKGKIRIKILEGDVVTDFSLKEGDERKIFKGEIHSAQVGAEGCRYIVAEKH